jgi:cell division transport system ATP-binding protein
MTTDEILHIDGLNFGYPKSESILIDLSFTVKRGEILWFTGPSACGKTTLFRLLLSELTPDSGSGEILGKPAFGKRGRRRLFREIGVIRDHDRLLTERDLFANVAMPLQIKGWGEQRIARRVREVLRRLDLTGKSRHQLTQLSPSELRLASLAIALAKDPPLILADLNSSEVDQQTLVNHLISAAEFGSAVSIFSRAKTGPGEECRLGGIASVARQLG